MPMKLDQIRLTPYDACNAIPAGFKVAGEFKTRRAPSPMQHNWFSRHDSVEHEVFHKLATALATKPEGYTLDELKAAYDNDADKKAAEKIVEKFKSSWDHRHTGFDLVTDEATGTRFMLVWRDPRVHYAKEIGLEGDFSNVEFQKTPSYVERVPKLIEEAKQPKPEKAAAAPKAPKADKPKAEKAPKAAKAEAAPAGAPTGGYLAAYATIPAKNDKIPGNTIAEILENAINQFVVPDATMKDDPSKRVADELKAVVDKNGMESSAGAFVDFVAKQQKETTIKPGFYAVCKALAKAYAERPATTPAVEVPPSQAPAAEAPALPS